MSSRHAVFEKYNTTYLPSESSILEKWNEIQKENPNHALEMSEKDAAGLVALSALAEHHTFLFENLLPAMKNRLSWAWFPWLVTHAKLESPGDERLFRLFMERIELAISWREQLFVVREDGNTPWDHMLLYLQQQAPHEDLPMARAHQRAAILAEEFMNLSQERKDQPHPHHPDHKNKDVWLWGWCASGMCSSRLYHLTQLLASGASPNVILETKTGPMSAGSVLMWARSNNRQIPLLKVSEKGQTFESSFGYLWTWVRDASGDLHEGQPVKPNIFWAAMSLMKQSGMDPAALVEPTLWRTPLLGTLDRLGSQKNEWDQNTIEEEWGRLLSFGLSLENAAPSHLLGLMANKGKHSPVSPTTPPTLAHWKAPQALWDSFSLKDLESFIISVRGACLFLEEPRLVAALWQRLVATSPKEWTLPKAPLAHCHPLTPLATKVEEVVAQSSHEMAVNMAISITELLVQSVIQDAPHYPNLPAIEQAIELHLRLAFLNKPTRMVFLSDLETMGLWIGKAITQKAKSSSNLIRQASVDRTHAEQAALDELALDKNDQRPTILLHTEKTAISFENWAKGRKEEIVQTWLQNSIEKRRDLRGGRGFPLAARRLSKSSDALKAIAQLRRGFPHFGDIIDDIERHLILESRGNGIFSLPPLLMAGPPGTGKTFFFRELATYVDTSYTMLSMESVFGGFSITGLEYGYSSAAPGIVFETLMKKDSPANPIILLDEIDKLPDSNNPVGPVLLPLLEPHSARHFTDRCIPLTVDASHICWVATANDLEKVDAPLRSRFNVMTVPNPDYFARKSMARHIYQALRASHSWGNAFDDCLPEETLQALAMPAASARNLRKNLTKAFASAAIQQRSVLQPQDIPPPEVDVIVDPWDRPLAEPESTTPAESIQ